MATTIPQAEANLRAAALKTAALKKAYTAACEAERVRPGSTYEGGDIATYSPEGHVACRALNVAYDELHDAADALGAAVAAEQRAEAL